MAKRLFPYLTDRLTTAFQGLDGLRANAIRETEEEARQEQQERDRQQQERNRRAQQELQFRDIQTDFDADDIIGQRQALDEFSFNSANERILRNQAIAEAAQVEIDPFDPRRKSESDLSFADITSRITGVAERPSFPTSVRRPFSESDAGRQALAETNREQATAVRVGARILRELDDDEIDFTALKAAGIQELIDAERESQPGGVLRQIEDDIIQRYAVNTADSGESSFGPAGIIEGVAQDVVRPLRNTFQASGPDKGLLEQIPSEIEAQSQSIRLPGGRIIESTPIDEEIDNFFKRVGVSVEAGGQLLKGDIADAVSKLKEFPTPFPSVPIGETKEEFSALKELPKDLEVAVQNSIDAPGAREEISGRLEEIGFSAQLIAEFVFDPANLIPGIGFISKARYARMFIALRRGAMNSPDVVALLGAARKWEQGAREALPGAANVGRGLFGKELVPPVVRGKAAPIDESASQFGQFTAAKKPVRVATLAGNEGFGPVDGPRGLIVDGEWIADGWVAVKSPVPEKVAGRVVATAEEAKGLPAGTKTILRNENEGIVTQKILPQAVESANQEGRIVLRYNLGDEAEKAGEEGLEVLVILAEDGSNVVVDAQKFNFVASRHPNATLHVGLGVQPVVLKKGDEAVGILMPIFVDNAAVGNRIDDAIRAGDTPGAFDHVPADEAARTQPGQVGHVESRGGKAKTLVESESFGDEVRFELWEGQGGKAEFRIIDPKTNQTHKGNQFQFGGSRETDRTSAKRTFDVWIKKFNENEGVERIPKGRDHAAPLRQEIDDAAQTFFDNADAADDFGRARMRELQTEAAKAGSNTGMLDNILKDVKNMADDRAGETAAKAGLAPDTKLKRRTPNQLGENSIGEKRTFAGDKRAVGVDRKEWELVAVKEPNAATKLQLWKSGDQGRVRSINPKNNRLVSRGDDIFPDFEAAQKSFDDVAATIGTKAAADDVAETASRGAPQAPAGIVSPEEDAARRAAAEGAERATPSERAAIRAGLDPEEFGSADSAVPGGLGSQRGAWEDSLKGEMKVRGDRLSDASDLNQRLPVSQRRPKGKDLNFGEDDIQTFERQLADAEGSPAALKKFDDDLQTWVDDVQKAVDVDEAKFTKKRNKDNAAFETKEADAAEEAGIGTKQFIGPREGQSTLVEFGEADGVRYQLWKHDEGGGGSVRFVKGKGAGKDAPPTGVTEYDQLEQARRVFDDGVGGGAAAKGDAAEAAADDATEAAEESAAADPVDDALATLGRAIKGEDQPTTQALKPVSDVAEAAAPLADLRPPALRKLADDVADSVDGNFSYSRERRMQASERALFEMADEPTPTVEQMVGDDPPGGGAVDDAAGAGGGGDEVPPGSQADEAAGTPEEAGNKFVAEQRELQGIADNVSTVDDTTWLGRALKALIGKSGINPSIYRNSAVGKLITAYHAQKAAIDEMVEVALTTALDFHRTKGIGTIPFNIGRDARIKGLAAEKGASDVWYDVFSNPDAYKLTKKQRAFIDDFVQVVQETEMMRARAGLKPRNPRKAMQDATYIPRQVEEIRGVPLSSPSDPSLERHFELAEEGINAKIVYSNSPRNVLEVHLRSAYEEILNKQFAEAIAEKGVSVTAKELLRVKNPTVVARLTQAAKNLRVAQTAARARIQEESIELGRRAAARVPLGEDIGRAASPQPSTIFNRMRQDPAVIAAKIEADKARSAYNRALKSARKRQDAPGNLFGQQEDNIPVAKWRQRFFRRDDVKLLEEWIGSDFKITPKEMNWASKSFETFGNSIRFLSSVTDFAAPLIHGLPTLAKNPRVWARATVNHYKAFLDPTVQARFMREHLDTFKTMARHGTPIGDPEFFAVLRQGEGPSFGALFEMAPGGSEVRRVFQQAGRQSFGRWQASYNTFLGDSRALMTEAMQDGWKGSEASLQAWIRNMTGGLDSRALGIAPNQRGIEATWLAFSPRLLRSTVALVADAALFPVARATGKASTKQAESFKALATLTAGAMGVYVTTGLALGKSWEEIEIGMNPLNGKRFLSHQIGGDWVGIGGQVRAIAQIMATTGEAIYKGEPGSLIQINDDNPIIAGYLSRGAPGVRIAQGTIEAVAAESGGEFNTAPYDNIEGFPDLITFLGESALPFAAQGRLEGENWSTVALAMAGARTSPERTSEKINDRRLELAIANPRESRVKQDDGTFRAWKIGDTIDIPFQNIIDADPQLQELQVDRDNEQRERGEPFQRLEDRVAEETVEQTDRIAEISAEWETGNITSPDTLSNMMDEIGDLRGEIANKRDGIFSEVEFEEKTDTVRVAVNDFFAVRIERDPNDNSILWDRFFDGRDAALSVLTLSERASAWKFIRKNLTPIEKASRGAREVLDSAPDKYVFPTTGRPLTEGQVEAVDDFRFAVGREQDRIQLQENRTEPLDDIAKRMAASMGAPHLYQWFRALASSSKSVDRLFNEDFTAYLKRMKGSLGLWFPNLYTSTGYLRRAGLLPEEEEAFGGFSGFAGLGAAGANDEDLRFD